MKKKEKIYIYTWTHTHTVIKNFWKEVEENDNICFLGEETYDLQLNNEQITNK